MTQATAVSGDRLQLQRATEATHRTKDADRNDATGRCRIGA